MRKGDISGAREAAEADWAAGRVFRTKDVIILANQQGCRSTDHTLYRQRVMGKVVRHYYASLIPNHLTIFEVCDTEYVNHMARMLNAAQYKAEVMADATAQFVTKHVAQTRW